MAWFLKITSITIFNGKSLATFTSHDVIREVVYVESRIDSDQDGLPDLVKVNIIRPSLWRQDSSCYDCKVLITKDQR